MKFFALTRGSKKLKYTGMIYALKKEVAVLATMPHYALFSQRGSVGSTHDYKILKSTYSTYLTYLMKKTEETKSFPVDLAHNTWGMLFDRGYTGPETDTPGLRRIVIPKNTRTTTEIEIAKELSRIRCPVEQFFGRLQKLWKVTSKIKSMITAFLTMTLICVYY
eukprot:TRINITY_DN6259_c0_g2_i6.p1 TRINITY_DN6259_c0_g2~~TRINITY_DN6259_c0_g2_i6.p1  ORF type:complete len:164 (-),score=10.51 TRINITY_DN6259_c0_g2_i6:98-589(-)